MPTSNQGRAEMTVFRSERERRDEETGNWQLLDEIMASIRSEYQTAAEVIAALTTAMAKIIVQADFSAKDIERIKRRLDSQIDFQRDL
jgi:chromosome condensin MukBEF ATPase and DNA-binding subunit MukB